MQLAWADIALFVQEIHSKEDSRPNPAFYRTLGQQALYIIAEESGLVSTLWDNGAGGVLALVGNACALPADCLSVDAVEWGGNALCFKETNELDVEKPGWRTASGGAPSCYTKTGTEVLLDCVPSGDAGGKLVVRGKGLLGELSDDPNLPNPLALLPARFQLIPAYYILANLPVNSQNPSEVARQERYEAMWARELAYLIGCVGARKRERMEF